MVAAVPPDLRLSEAVVAGVVALELLALPACDCFFPMKFNIKAHCQSCVPLFHVL